MTTATVMTKISLINDESPLFDVSERFLIKAFFHCLVCSEENKDGRYYMLGKNEDVGVFKSLHDQGFVSVEEKIVWLTNEEGELYCNLLNPLLNESHKLSEMFNQLMSAKVSSRYRTTSMVEKIRACIDIIDKPKMRLKKVPDLIRVYEGVYCLIYQQDHREFTGKEVGQFQQLIRFYPPVTAAKMCISYLTDDRVNAPNIGTLLVKKDEYFHSLNSSKRKTNAGGSF